MGDLNDIVLVDGTNYPMALYLNKLFAGLIRAEYYNAQTISATLELDDADYWLQVITPSGADRTVELAPPGTGNHVTVVYNASATYNILVKDSTGTTTYATIAPAEMEMFVPISGVGWKNSQRPQVVLSSASPRVYTSNATWTKPTGLKYIIVEAVGGGGGGGGCTAASGQAACANGGGGGAYKKKRINESSLGSTETVTVGAGGAGGAAGLNNGSNGGASSFGSHVSAEGGSGGNYSSATSTVPVNGTLAGGAGGTLTGALGDINIPGSPSIGGAIWSTTAVQSSVGGASFLSGSVRNTTSSADDANGITGSQYGGGGSGAMSSNDTTNRAGGDGAGGVVIVWEYVEQA